MPDIITFFADFANLRTRANQTFDIIFNVNELAPEEAAVLISFLHRSVSVAVKNSPITNEEAKDIPEPQREFATDKTPSQRLRAVLYVYYQQRAEQGTDFDSFYKKEMEKIIEHYKGKLE